MSIIGKWEIYIKCPKCGEEIQLIPADKQIIKFLIKRVGVEEK